MSLTRAKIELVPGPKLNLAISSQPELDALADLLARVRRRRAEATGKPEETTRLPREKEDDHGD